MLITYTAPVMDRLSNLQRTLPTVLAAAVVSPPVEVVLVDYSNPPAFHDYVRDMQATVPEIVALRVVTVPNRQHYHMAHAHNVGIKAAAGDYVMVSCADVLLCPDTFAHLRERIAQTGADYLHPFSHDMRSVIMVRRQVLLEVGGYDERFEFYSPDDKDLHARLIRAGVPKATYPNAWIDMIRQTEAEKVKHYRERGGKHHLHRLMMPIYEENNAGQVVTVNVGTIWGETWAARTDGVPEPTDA